MSKVYKAKPTAITMAYYRKKPKSTVHGNSLLSEDEDKALLDIILVMANVQKPWSIMETKSAAELMFRKSISKAQFRGFFTKHKETLESRTSVFLSK